jgi:hypothetical protein
MQNDQNNQQQDNALDLQTMMFKQMQRLSDVDTNDLEKEIKRAQALSSAGTIIINAEKVKIDRKRLALQERKNDSPKQLSNGD